MLNINKLINSRNRDLVFPQADFCKEEEESEGVEGKGEKRESRQREVKSVTVAALPRGTLG